MAPLALRFLREVVLNSKGFPGRGHFVCLHDIPVLPFDLKSVESHDRVPTINLSLYLASRLLEKIGGIAMKTNFRKEADSLQYGVNKFCV